MNPQPAFLSSMPSYLHGMERTVLALETTIDTRWSRLVARKYSPRPDGSVIGIMR